ncbi:MAG: transglycosylase SLT domain-containing protein [Desulfobacteraceae bacterium]|nr:transglycosylase SLT domain-containing protein [Desulfobacteraceae bacterium]
MPCSCFSKSFIITVSLIFCIPFSAFSYDIPDYGANYNKIPSLVKSLRFSKEISFCDTRIPIENQDVRQRFEKEFLLALWNRPQVILWIKRASRYFFHIEKILKDEGLHPDLKYVAVIESALRPYSRSSKGATGFWQFIRSTGRRYGLRIDHRVDERRNLFKSTRAACRYIKKLNNDFDGSMLLSLSAYNMGENALRRVIDTQESKDYFSLYLPLETQQYIFKMIVCKIIMENPAKYGFEIEKQDLYPVFEFSRVKFDSEHKLPLMLIAQSANVSFKVIKDMNPEIKGYYLSKGKISIFIPKGKEKNFAGNFSKLYAKWQRKHATSVHVVKKGESLSSIARKYQIPLSALVKKNNLSLKSMIHPGDKLIVESKTFNKLKKHF